MEFYIALLRGVNVGGKNPVPMAQLKTALEERGFSHVSTYINSGNIFFASPRQDVIQLQNCCRQVILDRFGLDIAVAGFVGRGLSAGFFSDAVLVEPGSTVQTYGHLCHCAGTGGPTGTTGRAASGI